MSIWSGPGCPFAAAPLYLAFAITTAAYPREGEPGSFVPGFSVTMHMQRVTLNPAAPTQGQCTARARARAAFAHVLPVTSL